MCGAHRMIDKHFVMYDDVVRVPLLARWPARIAAGSVNRDFVSATLDLPTTFLESFGVPVPGSFQGMGLGDHFQDAATHKREDIFATYHGNQMGLYTQRMVANGEWKYIWNATAEDELYHTAADPDELVNRVGDQEAREPLERMQKRLIHWMEECGDPILNAWTRKCIANAGAD